MQRTEQTPTPAKPAAAPDTELDALHQDVIDAGSELKYIWSRIDRTPPGHSALGLHRELDRAQARRDRAQAAYYQAGGR